MQNYFIIRLVVCTAIIITLMASPVRADAAVPVKKTPANSEQESIVEQDNNLFTETEALVEDLEAKSLEAKEKFALFRKSAGEERSMLGVQVLDIEAKIRKSLDKLISNINALDEKGIDTVQFFSIAKDKTKEQSDFIISEIKLINKLIDDVAKKREETKPADLFLLEQDINQGQSIVDKLIKALFENTKRMKLVGLDASKDLKYLKKELQELAKNLSTLIKLNDEKITQLKEGIEKAGESQSQDLQSELDALEEREAGLIASLRSTINLMEKLGLETSDYNLQLIRSVGQIDEALLDKKVIVGLLEQWITDAKNWLAENVSSFLAKAFTFVLILVLFKLLAKLSENLVRKAIASSKGTVSKLLQDFIQNMVSKLVMLIGVLVALAHVGVQIGPLLAGLGVAGFIIGFALQDTLSNFASGLMILFYRPYDVGDTIEAAGQRGTVHQMNLVSTTVFTFDNQRLIIPNNKIWGDIIRNVTAQESAAWILNLMSAMTQISNKLKIF